MLDEKDDLMVVGEAGDGLELLDLLSELNLNGMVPHLVILDIVMPNLTGIEAAHRIKTIYPGVKVMMLTMHKNEEYRNWAISAGLEGYLLKENANEELSVALDTIRQGKKYFSSYINTTWQ
jgi:DNA-binding NarL/FixJ family response regulator